MSSCRTILLLAVGCQLAATVAIASPLVPDDPFFPYSWHANKIGLPAAWEYSQGSSDVVMAIVDTGVISTEPDLAGRILPALSVTGPVPTGEKRYRHGTWVASAAAMQINNGIGGVGVGNFSILPIQATVGNVSTPEWIASAIRLAADRGARVINVSLQALTYGELDEAAAYARTKGALTFVAAGNSNSRNSMSGYDNLIFVGGTDSNDRRWVDPTHSTVGSTFGPYVDLSAPAVNILVADSVDPLLPEHYGYIAGTSFAAPLAAGAAALAWSINPNLTPEQVQSILFQTSLKYGDFGAPGWDEEFGWGRINVAAVAVAANATVPEPTSALVLSCLTFSLFTRRPRSRRSM
jgi:subtilisin family serine protease